MVLGRTKPDIHLRVGIEVRIDHPQQRRFVVEAFGDAVDERREVERHHVHADPDLRQVFLHHGGNAFALFVTRVGDERKLHRMAFAVVQGAVFQLKAFLLQPRDGVVRVVWLRLQIRIEPHPVGGRDRPNTGRRVVPVGQPADVSPTDRRRQSASKIRRTEPGPLVGLDGRLRYLVEPELLAVEGRTQVAHRRGKVGRQLVEILAVHRIDDLDLAAPEAQDFGVAVLLDVEPDGIEIGQLSSRVIFLPIVRVACQQNGGPRPVVGDHERSQHRLLFVRRARRHDGDRIEQSLESGHYRRKCDGDGVVAFDLGFHFARAAGAEGITQRRMEFGIHQLLHSVSDIGGGERRAVRKANAFAKLEADGAAAVDHLPGLCQRRLHHLRVPVETQQHAPGQVADGVGSFVGNQERVKSLGFGAQAEAKFSATLLGPARAGHQQDGEP